MFDVDYTVRWSVWSGCKAGGVGVGVEMELCSTSSRTVATWIMGFIHRWALTPISVISDFGLSLISELPISD